MTTNPYQPPAPIVEDVPPEDPLRLPARGCLIGAALGCGLAIYVVVMGVYHLYLFREIEDYERRNEARGLILSAAWFLLLVLLALVTAYHIQTRRRRWLVLSAAILGLTPLGGWLSMPVAALVLMRLWRKDVWNRFN